ncbi:TadE/TadG family type IV pilus assembly protein [Acetobacterium bakii]|uniref:Uncharacterized protein n=1 Tax=Acetobacterium bakii TaxID=52689 RepID=A0A0L6TZX4_9FIRM|nr:TadE/TadG family type IV pilus assembly protein [Acetobacterium bakii]KNZ41637.1 hypothetical protein AKG39_10585 [Acetobacterium bakii]
MKHKLIKIIKSGIFKKIKNEESGTIVIIVALAMVVILGFAALVIDVGRVSVEKSQLQNAIDAACLAGAQDLPDTLAAKATAYEYIALNGYQNSDVSVPVFSNSNQTISITGSKNVEYTFAKILGFDSATIEPFAAATKEGLGAAFGYTLFSGSPSYTLSINGSNQHIKGNAHSNYKFSINGSNQTIIGSSEAVSQFSINGSNINISKICQGSSITINGSDINIGSQIISPASLVAMPDFSEIIKSQAEAAGQYYTVNKTFNGSNMTVDDSIYVDGNVTINGSNFIGKGCILATGNLTFNGSNLTNATGDAVCFYSKNGNITINGSSQGLCGIIYAPNGTITLNGSNQTVNGRVIGNKVLINGSNTRIIGGTNELLSVPASSVRLTK